MAPEEREPTAEREPLPPVREWTLPDTSVDAVIVPPPTPEGAEVAPYAVQCKRCGETANPVNNCCAWCGQWLIGEPPRVDPVYDEEDEEPEDDWDTEAARRHEERKREPQRLVHPGWVIGIAYVFLIGSLFLMVIMAVAEGVKNQEQMYGLWAAIEVLDAVMTVVALALVWHTAKQKLPKGTILITWITAFPVLFAMLCFNIAYITFLRELFGAKEGEKIQVTFITVMLICVQPAIVEELFFRQMVLGVFRKWMNFHAAIWVTAAMFAFAHVGNIFGMPYLLVGGAIFGYARAFGGLSLAIVMHFIHNFVVIAYEAWK